VIISKMMGNEMRTIYTGKVSGNEIKFKAETEFPARMTSPIGSPMQPQPPQEIVAKRAGRLTRFSEPQSRLRSARRKNGHFGHRE
jgi:hypothetical protein